MKIETTAKISDRDQVRQMFRIDMIVSTISLSMGLDCSRISGVLHYNFPSCIESYVQQIGRSGRSGQDSTCITFLKTDDYYFSRSKTLIENYQPEFLLEKIVDYVCLEAKSFEGFYNLDKKIIGNLS